MYRFSPFHRIWGSDSILELPSDGTPPPQPRYFPPKSGFRFVFFTIPPDTATSIDPVAIPSALEEIQQKLPGLMDVSEPDHPGMHTADTVDFDVIVSGEVYLELDDGAEVLLKAGDCVIQNGTRHAWHNRSSEKCVISVAIVGAERKSEPIERQLSEAIPGKKSASGTSLVISANAVSSASQSTAMEE
jgi:mannose-6-phosphate isomerase-like protein (cupin superfamily)